MVFPDICVIHFDAREINKVKCEPQLNCMQMDDKLGALNIVFV